jgi:hypothetical protein
MHTGAYKFAYILLQIQILVFQDILVHTGAYQFAYILLKTKASVLQGILLHTGAYRRIQISCNLSQNLLFIPVPTNVLRSML